ERRAAAYELPCFQLPEGLPREQARLHDLGHPLRTLVLRQRLERGRVDDGAGGPVERTDEVLTLRQVNRRLAADRGVDLTDERRGYGHPAHAAQVRRGHEPDHVRRAAAPHGDDGPTAVEPQLAPEPVRDRGLLGGFALRYLVHGCEPRSQRDLGGCTVDAA